MQRNPAMARQTEFYGIFKIHNGLFSQCSNGLLKLQGFFTLKFTQFRPRSAWLSRRTFVPHTFTKNPNDVQEKFSGRSPCEQDPHVLKTIPEKCRLLQLPNLLFDLGVKVC
jgi:hypothetical protein